MAPYGSEEAPLEPLLGSSEGNTNPSRVTSSKRWCFTFHNHTNEQWLQLHTLLDKYSKKYIVGFEKGKSGITPHLQGFVAFNEKSRPIEKINIKKIHWEKTRGTDEDNFIYCSKEGDFIHKGFDKYILRASLIDPFKPSLATWWQNNVLNMVAMPPEPRHIYWFWETKGNTGKTTLAKHICLKYPKSALYLSGKGADIKYAVQQFIENGGIPVIMLFDFPRSRAEYISYPILEELKNGIFFSNKYEAGMCITNIPHVICFSNSPPNLLMLSEDRWKIISISNEDSTNINIVDE